MEKIRKWKSLTESINKHDADSATFDTPIRGINISICYRKQSFKMHQAFIVATVAIFISGEHKYRQFSSHTYEDFCNQWDEIVDTMVDFRQLKRAGDGWRKIPFCEDLYYRKKHIARSQLEHKLAAAA